MSTEVWIGAVGVLLCGALLTAVLRPQRPELAMGLSLMAGVLVVGLLLRQLTPLLTTLRRMAVIGGVGEGSLSVVLRAAGVCLLTQWTADTCRDVGETALAGKAELTGRLVMLLLSLPLYEQILTLVVNAVNGQAVTG